MATSTTFPKNQLRSSVESTINGFHKWISSTATNGYHSYITTSETHLEDSNSIPNKSAIIQEFSNYSEDNQTMCSCCCSRVGSKCQECLESLCQECVYTHACSLRHTKNGFQKKDIIMCNTHLSEKATFHCNKCNVFICLECPKHLHQGHALVYIQEAIERTRADTMELLMRAKYGVTVVKEALEKANKMSDAVNEIHLKKIAEIHSVMQKYILAIQKRERDLVQNLERVRIVKCSSLQVQLKDLQDYLFRLEQTKESLVNALASGSVTDLLWETERAKVELNQLHVVNTKLLPYEDNYINFIQPDLALLQAVLTMGLIHSSACSLTTIANGDGLTRATMNRIASFTLQVKDHLDQPVKNSIHLIRIKILELHTNLELRHDVVDNYDGSYTVSYCPTNQGEHRIYIYIRGREIPNSPFHVTVHNKRNYNQITSALFEFGEEGDGDGQFCRPWGVCCDKKGNIIVADRSNNRIQIFNPDGTFKMKFGSHGSEPGQFDRPAGVDADRVRDRIVVSDKDNHRIQVFTNNGGFILQFGEKGEGNGQFNYPWDVAVNQEGQIAVSDSRNHRVQLFTSEGVFLKKFGYETQPNMWKHFDCPRGICFNSAGKVNVTDFNNHTVVMIDPSFLKSSALEKEGSRIKLFVRPQGIVIDDEGHIIVSDSRNNRIQVFERNGSFLAQFGRSGKSLGEFDCPSGICLSPDGKIIVVDFGNSRIQVF